MKLLVAVDFILHIFLAWKAKRERRNIDVIWYLGWAIILYIMMSSQTGM